MLADECSCDWGDVRPDLSFGDQTRARRPPPACSSPASTHVVARLRLVANALVRPGHLRATAFLAKRSSARGARDDSSWGDCGAAWRSMTIALRVAAGGCCGRSRLLSLDVCEADQAPGPAAPLTTIALHGSAKAGMKTSAEPGECSRLEARGNSAPPRPLRGSQTRGSGARQLSHCQRAALRVCFCSARRSRMSTLSLAGPRGHRDPASVQETITEHEALRRCRNRGCSHGLIAVGPRPEFGETRDQRLSWVGALVSWQRRYPPPHDAAQRRCSPVARVPALGPTAPGLRPSVFGRRGSGERR